MGVLIGLLLGGILILFSPSQAIAPEEPFLEAQKPLSLEEKVYRYQASDLRQSRFLEPLSAKNWVLETGLVAYGNEQWRIMECESYPSLNPKACNLEKGCEAGMGLWGFTERTWNETIIRMAEANFMMPQHCYQFVFLPVSERRDEVVFDPECNLIVGLWLYREDGNRHWGSEKDDWGSWKCWNYFDKTEMK